MKGKNYKGFGETHGLREWARLLGVNKDTLRYWLTTKGKTIEEFASANNIKFIPTIDTGRKRINRAAQAEDLLAELFTRSGYDPEKLMLIPNRAARYFDVYYDEEPVGPYYLDTGALYFTCIGGSSINLIKYPVPNPKVRRYPRGWDVHSETKIRLVDLIMSRAPAELDYSGCLVDKE